MRAGPTRRRWCWSRCAKPATRVSHVCGAQCRFCYRPSSGTARVIVLLDVPFAPEGTLSAAAAAQQRQAIAAAQAAFVSEVVKGSASKLINRLAWMPAVVLEIDAPTLERIKRSKRVKAIEPDQLMQPMAPAALPGAPQ